MTFDPEHTWAIVLAGGEGTRLASLTKALYGHAIPKQFAVLSGRRSMLRVTIARVARLVDPKRIVVVVGPNHGELARAQLGASRGVTLLVQPEGRGTAIAILYGLAWIRAHDGLAAVLTFPSDHYVADERGFIDAARDASIASSDLGGLVLLGTLPHGPDADYGWIVPGAAVVGRTSTVARFVEKPAAEVAERLQREGGLWNTFVFAAPAEHLAAMARIHLPDHAARFDAWAFGDGPVTHAFRDVPAADFSRDVLQHAPDLFVSRMPDVGWSDWGTPERVYASLHRTPTSSAPRPLGVA